MTEPALDTRAAQAVALTAHDNDNARPRSVLVDLAHRYGMEPGPFEATLRATVCRGNLSREDLAAFCLVAKEHRLNPVLKEIYALPAKGGGIVCYVSVDGWTRIINDHPAFDGLEFVELDDEDTGELVKVTCTIHRKDRAHPISVPEHMAECKKNTDQWRERPRRMLRHKSLMQCARYAFGFSNIYDYEEALTISQGRAYSTTVPPVALTAEFSPPAVEEAPEPPDEPIEAEFVPANDEVELALAEPVGPMDLIAWAGALQTALPGYQDVEIMRADWRQHADDLKAAYPSTFKALNRAVADRALEIERRTAP